MHRKNQVGTVARINGDGIVVRFDLYNDRGRCYPTLNIQTGYGNPLFRNQDKFIKIETHTEIEYRVGDKVLCYRTLDNNHPFIGTVKQKRRNGTYCVADELGINHILTKTEILFLLERTQYKVGDEIIVKDSSYSTDTLYNTMGYDQSIPTRIDAIGTSHSFIRIEIDDPKIGWRERDERNRNSNHSYWTLTDRKSIFPKEFAYSLPYVEYLKSEKTNIQTSIRGTRASSIEIDEYSSPLSYYVGNLECDLPPTTKLIHDYSYKPKKLNFFSKEDEQINDGSLFLGLEIEISGSTKDIDNKEDAGEIMKIFKKTSLDEKSKDDEFIYFKHDSSLNGFEIVTHPHTPKALEGLPWKEFFKAIKRMKYTNDDKKAGTHIHISRSFFGDITQQNEALAKMVFLMYKFKEEIEPLAGRKDSDYATYSSKALERSKEEDLFGTFRWYCDSCGKYSAINCQHKDTFEIRIFDGVTDKVRLMDILNFIENLCAIVKCTSITDITKVRLEDFMPFLRSIEG